MRVDIDDTLMTAEKTTCKCGERIAYINHKPIQAEIDRLNALYYDGYIILIETGRGWDCYELTKRQLAEMGIMYHELIMGKPPGIYIDATDCAKTLEGINDKF